jgi:Rieske Fe-S protein
MTSRRLVLAGGCAAMLAGCQTYGEVAQAPVPDGGATTLAAPSTLDSEAPGAPNLDGGTALAKLTDIPVGGGKVFTDKKVVITQPSPGVIKAFSAVCTHQGCLVTGVEDGTIVCPCHGSAFKLADGSVAAGPAKRALPGVAVTVTDGTIKLG